MSVFGDLKYPPDFKHFDYVNPNAPKGGTFSQLGSVRQFNQNFLTFNSLNPFILKGTGARHRSDVCALMAPSTIFSPAHDEPTPCTVWSRARCRYRWMDDLSLPAAARGPLPRRQQAYRA